MRSWTRCQRRCRARSRLIQERRLGSPPGIRVRALTDERRTEPHEAVREPSSPVVLFADDDGRISRECVGGSRDSILVCVTPRVRFDVRATNVAIFRSSKLEEPARSCVDAHRAKVYVGRPRRQKRRGLVVEPQLRRAVPRLAEPGCEWSDRASSCYRCPVRVRREAVLRSRWRTTLRRVRGGSWARRR
jgi:hypothetical protein